jgi:nitrile hydratase
MSATDDAELARRVEAIEQLLVEKRWLRRESIDAVVKYYETSVGPMNGARLVARAWTDPAFRSALLDDATKAAAQLGIGGPQGEHLRAVENGPGMHHVVVCTLCSCYPWPVLGLPPSWYKSAEYRSRMVREPRKVLAEMGLTLAEDVTLTVWDSSAEIRYFVLPQRPPGTEGLPAAELEKWVTRDSMIGVGLPTRPEGTR